MISLINLFLWPTIKNPMLFLSLMFNKINIIKMIIFCMIKNVWVQYECSYIMSLCVAAAGRPSWPGCHCVPCQSAVDAEGQELPTQCRGQKKNHPEDNMNLCWNEIKRKSHNIRYRIPVTSSLAGSYLPKTINLYIAEPGRHACISNSPKSIRGTSEVIDWVSGRCKAQLFCMSFVCLWCAELCLYI